MKALIKLMALLILIITFGSCTHSNTVGRMIPKNAKVIVHFNGHSLNSKLTWEDLKQSNWFNRMNNDSNMEAWIRKVLQKPELSGIDNKGDFIFFLAKGVNTDQLVFIGDIKDATNFASFSKNMAVSDAAIKDGNINFLNLKHEGSVGWNNKKFAFVFNKPAQNISDSSLSIHTGNTNNADAQAYCKSLFNLNEDSCMRNNNNFTTLLNEPGDVHIWQNTEEILKNGPQLGMLGMLKLDVFLKNNVSAYTVNFESGKIDVRQKWYCSKELMDVLSKYGGGRLHEEMLKNIPSQDVVALIGLHFKPQGIAELLKLTGMDGLLNMFLSKQGFNLDDFVKANKGDILFVVSDLQISKDTISNTGNKSGMSDSSNLDSGMRYHPSFNYLFSASIGDKASFNKVINAGKNIGSQMKKDSSLNYMMNDQFFVAGNNKDYVNRFTSGGNKTFSFYDQIKTHPLAIYIDINKVLSSMAAANAKDTSSRPALQEAIKLLDKAIVYGGEIEDGSYHVHSEIFLNDHTTNSLKQLNNFADQVSKTNHSFFKMHKDNEDHGYMDSTTVK